MKKNRTDAKIRRRKDIQQLFASPAVSLRGLKLFYRKNNMDIARVLITPGKKYGNAVERNYIKRVGRDIVRSNTSRFTPGYDIALVFYPGPYAYADRVNQVLALLRRTSI